jgi:hypothetical protein
MWFLELEDSEAVQIRIFAWYNIQLGNFCKLAMQRDRIPLLVPHSQMTNHIVNEHASDVLLHGMGM